MGYHDVNPLILLNDPAFMDTNSTEEGILFGKWMVESLQRAKEKIETAAGTTISMENLDTQ